MSLFDQLRRLYCEDRFRLEDFHTEIVAQVLRNSRPLTLAWLQGIGVTTMSNPDWIKIATQETFAALPGHLCDSRPDIAIRLTEGERTQLILIESKVGTKEGFDHLERYAEHLLAKKDLTHRGLVFITRDFEVPPPLPPLPSNCNFVATRWFTFFHYLNAHANGDGLAAELKLFMEENRMSLHNQFRSVDALALESFLGAKALMDETLWGDVSYKFEDVLGKVSSCCKASLQLGKHGRYVMYAQLGKGWDFECLLGYWLPNQSPTAAVRLGVAFTSNPKSLVRTQVIEAFRKLAEKSDGAWASGGLFDAKAWAWVSKGRDLPALMGPGDHVQAIKRHFLQLLNEVKAFKDEHPGLPWAVQGIDAEE